MKRAITGQPDTGRGFPPTQWTAIERLASLDTETRKAWIASLLLEYRAPVYAHLRRRGLNPTEALDIAEDFLTDKFLDERLLLVANRSRGNFRSLLITALERYQIDRFRKQKIPNSAVLPLDEHLENTLSASCLSPREAYDYVWACGLLDRVLAVVENAYRYAGKEAYWELFRRRVLAPILDGVKPPPLPVLCKELGISHEQTASAMIATVKRRFRTALRAVAGEDAASDRGLDDIRALRDALAATRSTPVRDRRNTLL